MLQAGPTAYLCRRYHFSASHRLHVDELSPNLNRELFGKCNNPFGHGHNYTVQVTYGGPVHADTGMVTDLSALDAFVQEEVLAHFDMVNLNMLDCFRDAVPSTENLCLKLWLILAAYPHAKLTRIRVEETNKNAFDYFGEGAPIHQDDQMPLHGKPRKNA